MQFYAKGRVYIAPKKNKYIHIFHSHPYFIRYFRVKNVLLPYLTLIHISWNLGNIYIYIYICFLVNIYQIIECYLHGL